LPRNHAQVSPPCFALIVVNGLHLVEPVVRIARKKGNMTDRERLNELRENVGKPLYLWKAEDVRFILSQLTLREDQIDKLQPCKEFYRAVKFLREGIAESLTFVQENDNPPPGNLITCNGEWTDWKDQDFKADTIQDCLDMAVAAKEQAVSEANG
jgi:hypothetical protein